MTKSEFKILEKVFAEETNVSLPRNLRLYQGKSKYLKSLEEAGYIEKVSYTLKGGLPVTVSGYVTTMEGHIYYCMNC